MKKLLLFIELGIGEKFISETMPQVIAIGWSEKINSGAFGEADFFRFIT